MDWDINWSLNLPIGSNPAIEGDSLDAENIQMPLLGCFYFEIMSSISEFMDNLDYALAGLLFF